MAYHDGFTNEERAYLANKGWDRLDDTTAAQTIVKSYMNLEKMRPAPVEVPKTAAEYKFDGVTGEPATIERARALAFASKLSPDAAKVLATTMVADAKAMTDAAAKAAVDTRAAAEAALKASWKDEHDSRLEASNRALAAAGFSPEDIEAMAGVKGFDKVHEMGYGLSTKMGEAPLLKGGNMTGNQPKWTRETALTERNRLMTDQDFGAKFASGDKETMATVEELSRAILGDPASFQPPPENFGRKHDNFGHEVPSGDPRAI